MTAPTQAGQQPASSSGSGFSAHDWATVIQGAGQGAANVFNSMGQMVSSKREARESKRKTIAKLLNNALNRNFKLMRAGQEYSDEMNDFKAKQMQDIARGFVDSLSGSTRRRG